MNDHPLCLSPTIFHNWFIAPLYTASFLLFFSIICETIAQSPSMVPENLKFTQEISQKFHIVARVTLTDPDGTDEKFQYDLYPINDQDPGMERIKRSEGVFVRSFGGHWLRSDGDAKGNSLDKHMVAVLDTDVNVVTASFGPGTNRDKTQGGTIWRYVGATPRGSITEYSFEESREHPKPDVFYPRYIFMKAPGDTDGRLFLCGVTANLRDDKSIIPLSMHMSYLVPVPAGTKVHVYDKATGKEKLNTITGPNSGWEIETKASEPPSSH